MTIKIHHLNRSRSTRIIWLMEELGLPYELVVYDRDAHMRAPKSLEAAHPLGKAPVIEDGDTVIAESGAIIEYIVATYGGGRLRPAAEGPRWAAWIEWLHYAEGSAMMPILVSVLGARAGLTDAMKGFIAPEVAKALGYIQDAVTAHGHLMAEGFTAADIQMFYVLEAARMGGLLKGHEGLSAYLERIEARPAFVKALAAGGPVRLPSGGAD